MIKHDALHDGKARPVPSLFVVKYGSKMLFMSASGIPLPVSLTAMRQKLVCAFFTMSACRESRPPSGMAWIALVKRLAKTRLIWSLSPSRTIESGTSRRSMSTAAERFLYTAATSSSVRRKGKGAGRGTGSFAKSPNSRSILSRFSTSVMIEDTPQGCSTFSKSGAFSSCFFNILCAESLIGVRGFLISWARRCAISCHAVILSAWTSCRRGALELRDHSVEGVREGGKLVARTG